MERLQIRRVIDGWKSTVVDIVYHIDCERSIGQYQLSGIIGPRTEFHETQLIIEREPDQEEEREREREKQKIFADQYALKITMWCRFCKSIEIWQSVARRQCHRSWPSPVIACNLECSHRQNCTERYQVTRSVDTVCVVFSSHRSRRDSIWKMRRSIPDYIEVTNQRLIIKLIEIQSELFFEKTGSVTHL